MTTTLELIDCPCGCSLKGWQCPECSITFWGKPPKGRCYVCEYEQEWRRKNVARNE